MTARIIVPAGPGSDRTGLRQGSCLEARPGIASLHKICAGDRHLPSRAVATGAMDSVRFKRR